MLYSTREKITKKYDVIVVGGGIAGMTLANKLALNGRNVLLLEAHNKLGGFATWFRRPLEDGGMQFFDVSLHGFPVGMIKSCRKYWNKAIADRIVQIKKVRYINPQFDLETDFTKEHFSQLLVEKFGVDNTCVSAFFEELQKMNFYDNSQMTNRELFEKFFPGRNDIVRFLLEPIVYANGSNLDDPAISYGIVFSNFMSQGVYIFQGGTDLMVSMMKEELLKNGVDIKLQAPVEKIQMIDKKATGVWVSGQLIEAKSVVSNGNLKSTLFKMVGAEHFSQEFLKRAQNVRLNSSSCQVYMALKSGESIPYVGDLIFTSEDETFNTNDILSSKVGSQTFSLYYPEMRPNLPPRFGIVSSSNARFEDWCHLNADEYESKKSYLIERAIAGIEKIIPGIRNKIVYTEAATPLTVKRFTLHEEGASFGTKFEGLDISMNLKNEIPGLFHTGSVGIIMSGWLGALNYGVICAHDVETYLSVMEKNNQLGPIHE